MQPLRSSTLVFPPRPLPAFVPQNTSGENERNLPNSTLMRAEEIQDRGQSAAPTPKSIDFKPRELLGSASGELGLRKYLQRASNPSW